MASPAVMSPSGRSCLSSPSRWAPARIPGAAHVRGTAREGCSHVCSHFSFSSCFLAGASAQESQDSETVAATGVMRYADSRQLLPPRDAGRGECQSRRKGPALCWPGGGCGLRVRLLGDRRARRAQLGRSLGSWAGSLGLAAYCIFNKFFNTFSPTHLPTPTVPGRPL